MCKRIKRDQKAIAKFDGSKGCPAGGSRNLAGEKAPHAEVLAGLLVPDGVDGLRDGRAGQGRFEARQVSDARLKMETPE